MNDSSQTYFDFRTGIPTAISGDRVSGEVRSACSALNRWRARGFLEAAQQTPPSQSVSPDVWTTSFGRTVDDWEIPLIDLTTLGLRHDADGFISSGFLVPLTAGAEAQPYLDEETRTVYKLFDLRTDGSLGKKLVFNLMGEGFEVDYADATWIDTMEKLSVLNDGGGLPTEIIGLATTGDYLLAKQPFAVEFEEYASDREKAEENMRGIIPIGGGLRQHVIISHVDGCPWIVGDLHERNIMRDSNGVPRIIDALLGKVTPRARRRLKWLNDACVQAENFRLTNHRPTSYSDSFGDVNDEDL